LIGYFTVLLAARLGPSGKVVAYEPSPSNADLLSRSIRENRQEGVVTLRRVAVGEHQGELDLAFVPEERTTSSGGAFLVAAGMSAPRGHRTTRVPVVALDEEVMPGRVSLIKIDVEGAEPRRCAGHAAFCGTIDPRSWPSSTRTPCAEPAPPPPTRLPSWPGLGTTPIDSRVVCNR